MNENHNIEFTSREQNSAAQQTVIEQATSNEVASPVEIEQPTTDKQPQATENTVDQNTSNTQTMEVHHPHHPTHKKKWSEYLLEFFMLFLAVFLGFIAESIRETSVERHREKEYIVGLVQNLKSDTATLNIRISRNFLKNQMWDSLMSLVQVNLSAPANAKKFYTYFMKGSFMPVFTPNDAALIQLKNSGNLRLVIKKGVSDSILNYDNWNKLITNHNEHYSQQGEEMWNAAYPIMQGWVMSDTSYVDFYKRQATQKMPPPLTLNPQQVQVFFGVLARTLLFTQTNRGYMMDQQKRAERLIALLQQQYKLESE